MVQVLTPNQQKSPTFMQSVMGGLSEGIPKGIERYQQLSQQKALKEKFPELAGLPPELQKIALTEQLRGQSKENLLKQKQEMFASKFGNSKTGSDENKKSIADLSREEALELENMGFKGISSARESAVKENEKHADRIREKQAVKNLLRETGDYDEEEMEQLSESYDVPTARALNLKKKEPPIYEPEAQKLAAQRTDKYITSVEAKGRAAEEKLRGLEEGMMLHKQGATGFKLTNKLSEYFKNPALADPASKAFNAAMKSQYSGIGDIVKGKVSNFEFQTFEKRIATAEDSPQAAEALMVSAMMESKIAKKEMELTEELRRKYYEQGKSPPADFDLEVSKDLRPYADLILAQTNKQLLNILNPTKKEKFKEEDWQHFFPSLQ